MEASVVEAVARLSDLSRHGVVVHDASGVVVWANRSAAELLATTLDELVGARGLGDPDHLAHADGTPLEPSAVPVTAVLDGAPPYAEAVIGIRPAPGDDVVRWLEVEAHRIAVDVTEDVDDRSGSAVVASILVDLSTRHDTRSEVTATLRAFELSLQPGVIAEHQDLEIEARCRPASGSLIGGGDFYDVVETEDGSLAFLLGDVQGHGVAAATETALARHTLRTGARHAGDPATALRWLHDALVASGSGRSCTAVVGVARRSGDVVRVTFALSGHPRPMLVRQGAPTTFVGDSSTLLGSVEPVQPNLTDVVLGPGTALVCYTDGLTDAAQPRLTDDELLAAVSWRATAAELADAVMTVGAGDNGTMYGDDTAMLVIARPAS